MLSICLKPFTIAQSLSNQLPSVSFQGALGAFSDSAIKEIWPSGAFSVPCKSFEGALEELISGRAGFSVIPEENRIAGKVDAAIAAVAAVRSDIRVITKYVLPIRMALLAPLGASIGDLHTALSHKVALAQCSLFFAAHPRITPRAHYDTAGAAHEVSQMNDLSIAAIASVHAASRYNLSVLADSIQDVPDNWTRFLVLQRRGESTT